MDNYFMFDWGSSRAVAGALARLYKPYIMVHGHQHHIVSSKSRMSRRKREGSAGTWRECSGIFGDVLRSQPPPFRL